MKKIILKVLPWVLLATYIGFNEYRLSDYSDVRFDAIIAVHYPELIPAHRAQSGQK